MLDEAEFQKGNHKKFSKNDKEDFILKNNDYQAKVNDVLVQISKERDFLVIAIYITGIPAGYYW